ncbi:unnamed protein product [Paramecium pentaurelia]|uniref:Uncharacterized protein n=1 Tax=Paramecium pentaurelia TaxID=43138 RepID=A0A8S1TX20_9CILI|nr:unnamed protein product [Paramecium pentaurelia]
MLDKDLQYGRSARNNDQCQRLLMNLIMEMNYFMNKKFWGQIYSIFRLGNELILQGSFLMTQNLFIKLAQHVKINQELKKLIHFILEEFKSIRNRLSIKTKWHQYRGWNKINLIHQGFSLKNMDKLLIVLNSFKECKTTGNETSIFGWINLLCFQ